MLVVAGFSAWFVGVLLMLVLAGRILGPLERAARSGSQRLQFTLADWICLIGMAQAWAAATHTLTGISGDGLTTTLAFDAYGWLLIVLLWLGVVWRLSSAGIRRVPDRCVTILFVYPICVAATIAAPGLLWFAAAGLLTPLREGPALPWALASGLAAMILVGLMLLGGAFVRAMMRPERKSPDCRG